MRMLTWRLGGVFAAGVGLAALLPAIGAAIGAAAGSAGSAGT